MISLASSLKPARSAENCNEELAGNDNPATGVPPDTSLTRHAGRQTGPKRPSTNRGRCEGPVEDDEPREGNRTESNGQISRHREGAPARAIGGPVLCPSAYPARVVTA